MTSPSPNPSMYPDLLSKARQRYKPQGAMADGVISRRQRLVEALASDFYNAIPDIWATQLLKLEVPSPQFIPLAFWDISLRIVLDINPADTRHPLCIQHWKFLDVLERDYGLTARICRETDLESPHTRLAYVCFAKDNL